MKLTATMTQLIKVQTWGATREWFLGWARTRQATALRTSPGWTGPPLATPCPPCTPSRQAAAKAFAVVVESRSLQDSSEAVTNSSYHHRDFRPSETLEWWSLSVGAQNGKPPSKGDHQSRASGLWSQGCFQSSSRSLTRYYSQQQLALLCHRHPHRHGHQHGHHHGQEGGDDEGNFEREPIEAAAAVADAMAPSLFVGSARFPWEKQGWRHIYSSFHNNSGPSWYSWYSSTTVPQQLVQLAQLDPVLGKCWTQWKDCTQSEAENVFGGKTIVNACPPSKAGVEDTPKDSYIQYSPPSELPCIVFICVSVCWLTATHAFMYIRTGSSKGVHANMCPIHLQARVGNSSTNSSTVPQQFHQSRATLNFLISTWRAFFEIGLGLKILWRKFPAFNFLPAVISECIPSQTHRP